MVGTYKHEELLPEPEQGGRKNGASMICEGFSQTIYQVIFLLLAVWMPLASISAFNNEDIGFQITKLSEG